VAQAQAAAGEGVGRGEAIEADAGVQSEMVLAGAAAQAGVPRAEEPAVAQAAVAARVSTEISTPAEAEAAARAEIAQLVSRLAPVEVWVHMMARTVAEAREAALSHLGVDEAEAEIEVLSKGSRLLPDRARVRARIRVADGCHS
jgi:hypothetical protein